MSASNTLLEIESLDQRHVTVGGAIVRTPMPTGLAARVARAAHDAIAQLAPSNTRPSLDLDWDGGSYRLTADETDSGRALADALGADVIVHRGREGGRLVVGSDVVAFCQGWPLDPGVPFRIGHGDVLRIDGRHVAVRNDPPQLPLVRTGGIALAPMPKDVAFTARFAIEPSGEPLELRCDPLLTRALVCLVLRHDAERPFDPTALTNVEQATLDWLTTRIAERIGTDVFANRVAFRLAASDVQTETWVSAVIGVGPVAGTAWIGTSAAGSAAIASALAHTSARQVASSPALRGVFVTMAARIALGRLDAATVAAVEPGDVFASSDVPWIGDAGWSSHGSLVLTSADSMATHVSLERDDRGQLRATLLGRTIEGGNDDMRIAEPREALEDDARPFADALDAIGVDVAIEVARRRIRLSEALALSTGDVFELGSPVTARVSLMIDGAPFATGELVNVDGALGVRVVGTGGRR